MILPRMAHTPGPRRYWAAVAIYVIIGAAIIGAGTAYHATASSQIRKARFAQLAAVADMQTSMIEAAMNQLFRHGQELSQSHFLNRAIIQYVQGQASETTVSELQERLRAMLELREYQRIVIFAEDASVRLSVPSSPIDPSPLLISEVMSAMQSGEVALGDIVAAECIGPHMHLLVPISDPDTEETVRAVMVICIEPDSLFGNILQWQHPDSVTGETVIARREGDSVVFLSRLRHSDAPLLSLRVPARSDLLSVGGFSGNFGVVEGVDYRGARVFGTARRIEGTAWVLIAKMDKDEVYGQLARANWAFGPVVALGILTLGLLIASRFRYIHHAQLASVLEQCPVAISFIQDMRIRYVNTAYVQAYGWDSAKDLVGKSVLELTAPEKREERRRRFEKRGPRFSAEEYETMGVKRDGTTFPILVKAVGADLPNGRGSIGFVMDLTERKRAEQALELEKERLAITLRSIGDGVIATDRESRIVLMNDMAEKLTGWSREDAHGQLLSQVFLITCEGTGERVADPVAQVIETGQIIQLANHTVLTRRDGSKRIIEDSAAPIVDHDGRITGVVLVFRDVTEKKAMQDRLEESERRYRLIADNMSDMVMLMDLQFRPIFISPSMVKARGYSLEELQSMPLEDRMHSSSAEAYRKAVNALLHEVIESGTKALRPLSSELEISRKDGTSLWVESMTTVLTDEEGVPVSILAVARDITERKQYEERLKHLSFHDSLTGLYNRTFWEEEATRLDTNRQIPMSVIMADLNGLKLVNDAFGHVVGDEFIRKAAKAISGTCRQDDVVARWGGDEFVIFLPKTDAAAVVSICERIKKAFDGLPADPVQITAALGWATKTSPQQTVDQLVIEAENLMYRNKLMEGRSTRSSIISSLRRTLDERTHETEEHSERLNDLAIAIGRRLGLSDAVLKDLSLLCTLHDIGKLGIPDQILNKPGRLTEDEWAIMREHPEIGARIALSSYELSHLAQAIRAHHERWDGTGYPDGAFGESIPLISRILAVADAFDVMTHERCYKKAMTKEQALEELKKGAGSQFDPHLVSLFIEEAEGGV